MPRLVKEATTRRRQCHPRPLRRPPEGSSNRPTEKNRLRMLRPPDSTPKHCRSSSGQNLSPGQSVNNPPGLSAVTVQRRAIRLETWKIAYADKTLPGYLNVSGAGSKTTCRTERMNPSIKVTFNTTLAVSITRSNRKLRHGRAALESTFEARSRVG